mgnify:CR=1 FL=1
MLFVELLLYYFTLGVPVNDRMYIWNLLILLIMLFLNPVYIISGIAHVARSWDMTVFEISMLGGWLDIAFAKIVSITIYMIPYTIFQSIIVYLFSSATSLDHLMIVYLVLSVYLYVGLAILLSLVKSKVATLLTSAVALFIAPISISIIISNYQTFNTSLSPVLSAISYIFNPMLTYWYNIMYPGFVQLNQFDSIIIDTATMLCLYILFILLFRRSEMKV